MKSSFIELGISPPILKAIKEMGFEAPTSVQSKVIPHILNQEDLIVISKTGSGKTAVFGVTMLQLTDPEGAGPQGLILTPTRELAVQVDSDLKQMSKHLRHKTTAVYGQHNMNVEIQALNKGVSIVTGTPGRVFDHIRHGNLTTKHIRFLVLDEADRMLDMGFIEQVVRIIKTLPKDRVTLLFSATIPAEIRKMCREYMKNPATIEIESPTKTVDTIEQVYYRVDRNEKRTQLNRLLLVEQPESCLIFCNTRIAVDQVQSFLSRKGYASQALHGDIPQTKRLKTMQQFKQGEFHILVATDVAARGIHIDDLSLVINYDVPIEKDSYVHRIGRTGRVGKEGLAITLVTGDDIMSLYEIEEHIGALIAEAELPSETVFNEARAGAEQWIKVQANESKSPHATSLTKLKEVRKQPVPTKPFQRHDKPRDLPIEINADHKVTKSVRAVHPVGQAKPVHAVVAQPVLPHPPAADMAPAQGSPAIESSQDTTARKPFFKRILHGLLGK
jgi:ATP-dependent RNA helicase DeaD